MARLLGALHETLHEPRALSGLAVAAYLITAAMGIGLYVWQPASPLAPYEQVLRYIGGTMFLYAGLVGTPAAWNGAWWLERSAAIAALAGTGLGLFLVGWTHFEGRGLTLPIVTVGSLLCMMVLWLYRLSIVKERPYAVGYGPQLPEVEARLLQG